MVSPGDYSFPFSYTLPHSLPGVVSVDGGSFGSGDGFRGEVSYYVEASIDVAGSHNLRDRQRLIVNEARQGGTVAPAFGESSKTFLTSRGSLTMKIWLDHNAYFPGSQVLAKLEANNTSTREAAKVEARLVQHVSLRAHGRTKEETRVVLRDVYPGFQPSFYGVRFLPMSFPYSLTPTSSVGRHVSSRYELVYCCAMSGMATNLLVRLPVDVLAPQFLYAAAPPQGAPPLASAPAEVSYRPPWQPDSAAATCKLCQAGFGFFSRRHHCRHCGLVVCGACSAKPPVAIPALGYTEEAVRVCDACYSEASAGGRPFQVCPSFEAATSAASEPTYTPPAASAPPDDSTDDWSPPPVYPDLGQSASPHPTPPADPYPGSNVPPGHTEPRGGTIITPPPGAPTSPSHHEHWGTSSTGTASMSSGGARVDGAAPDADAQDLEARLRAEPFSSAKQALLSAVVATNRFNSAQAASLASAFDHDSHRLTALRTLYPVVVDKQHFVVATQSVLTFATHRRELSEWIASQASQQSAASPQPTYPASAAGTGGQPAYMPGTHNGAGPSGMDPTAFASLLSSIRQESYSASKLSLAGQALHGTVISTTQLAEISRAFSLDDDRISLVCLAYPKITDKDGMWRVYETLGSGAAKDELRRRLA